MSSFDWSKITQWLSRPEVWGVIAGVALPLLLTPFFIWWARRSRGWASLNAVNFLLFDVDKRFVHIIGPHTYMPDDSPTVDVYHHRLFDRTTGKIYQGGEQSGGGIDLDSQFLMRTTAVLEQALQRKLGFNRDKLLAVDMNSGPEGGRPVCVERDWFESDTTKTEPPPDFGVIFRQYDGDRDKFRIEVHAQQRLISTHTLPGSFSSFKGIYDAETHELLFVYSYGTFYRIALCVLNMSSGNIVLKKLVKPDIRPA